MAKYLVTEKRFASLVQWTGTASLDRDERLKILDAPGYTTYEVLGVKALAVLERTEARLRRAEAKLLRTSGPGSVAPENREPAA